MHVIVYLNTLTNPAPFSSRIWHTELPASVAQVKERENKNKTNEIPWVFLATVKASRRQIGEIIWGRVNIILGLTCKEDIDIKGELQSF